jgi:lipoprotein-anchoring transpeptidase ErfK/SrfK
MIRLLGAVLTLMAMTTAASAAKGALVARIDISEQRMVITRSGFTVHSWKISSGRGRYRTPTGNYRPQRTYKRYFSRKYNNAPMPHSVFFYRGYAIHGTNHIKSLGRPASHGCIRLHPNNAAKFFRLVHKYGYRNTRITIRR